MPDVDIQGTALRFGVGWGGPDGRARGGTRNRVRVPAEVAGIVLFGLAAFVAPAIVGLTDSGIETMAASSRIGFGSGNPNDYRAGHLPVPHPLELVCWLCGLGVVGLVTLALTV